MVSADRDVMAVYNHYDDDSVIKERKRVFAELEHEQTEIKRDIKSLMKTEATSRILEDPGLAGRVSNVRGQPGSYETAQDKATEKRMAEEVTFKAASPAMDKPKEAFNANKSHSTSSNKNVGQKRQWLAPSPELRDPSPPSTITTTIKPTQAAQPAAKPEPKKALLRGGGSR